MAFGKLLYNAMCSGCVEVDDYSTWKFLQNNFLTYHVVVQGRREGGCGKSGIKYVIDIKNVQTFLWICRPLIKHKNSVCVSLTRVAICHSGSSVPDVQNKEEDIAHLDHSPELPPCLDVQLKVAARNTRFKCRRTENTHINLPYSF